MTTLYPDTQAMNEAKRTLVELIPADALDDYAEPLFLRLDAVDPEAAKTLREQFKSANDDASRRMLIRQVHALCQAQSENELAAELENQRIALWLAGVGLLFVFTLSLGTHAHQPSLLLGAIGGFLAPLVKINNGQRAASWGVMVLSPVGGALTAIGGLLLVRLLSDDKVNVLGPVLRDNSWEHPTTALALSLALLFGFSGRLFSKLAIAGTSQLTGSND
ncbi:hypothetical protein [Amycolatopsis xylanica]|uniref:hypothetical protein n=1 Tax=Amycolatopsis xylanica TaxID=589385 RepID=UPI000B819236|nr:hypothetical protein [Amycolatopsis xylanica]